MIRLYYVSILLLISFSKPVFSNNPNTESLMNIVAYNTGPYCEGDDIILSVNPIEGASYSWTGPHGFSSSLRTPVISHASLIHAGNYTVTVKHGNDYAQSTTIVPVNPKPTTPLVLKHIKEPVLYTSEAVSYQWSIDGIDIPGENFQSIYLVAAGHYTVTVTNTFGCSSASKEYHHIVEEKESSITAEMEVYPNPTFGVVSLSLLNNHGKEVYITLKNVFGTEILTDNFYCDKNNYSKKIHINDYKPGLYHLKIRTEDHEELIKIIVQ
ncbi:MAG: T9SS type A sorting domain-containing protein [Cytophagaceae bacterium]|nr:T9SS type A sorting domain-containing protein [Cytophagaceae bacterium]